MKRIIQITQNLSYGDAIGNHILTTHKSLLQQGFDSRVYALYIDSRVAQYARPIAEYQNEDTDVILYHLSITSPLNRIFASYKGRRLICYHNITPPEFMRPYNELLARWLESAYQDAAFLKDRAELVIADSNYNGNDLRKMGYTCDIQTVPIIVDFEDFTKEPDPGIMEAFSKEKGITNILFVGRLAPNKKQEDVIADFYYYTKYFNPNSRLILIGSDSGLESYSYSLKKYVKELGLTNVIFPGHIPFSHILAYYRTADLFLCESEHEGFCVPLLEAMYFDIPVVAYDSSAVGETLGGAGFLLKEKNPQLTAAIVHEILSDSDLQERMKAQQRKRLEYFQSDVHLENLIRYLT